MRLFGVRDNALFSEQPKQQAAKLYQQFFRFVDDVGIVHIAGEPPLPPLVFDGVVNAVWVGDSKNLTILRADIQTIFFCRLAVFDAFKIRRVNKIFRQSIEPLIEDMAVNHIMLEIIQIDVVEKGTVVDEQDVSVIAACFAVNSCRCTAHRLTAKLMPLPSRLAPLSYIKLLDRIGTRAFVQADRRTTRSE